MAILSSTSPNYTISLAGVGAVTAYAQSGGTDTLNVQAVDYVFSHVGNGQ